MVGLRLLETQADNVYLPPEISSAPPVVHVSSNKLVSKNGNDIVANKFQSHANMNSNNTSNHPTQSHNTTTTTHIDCASNHSSHHSHSHHSHSNSKYNYHISIGQNKCIRQQINNLETLNNFSDLVKEQINKLYNKNITNEINITPIQNAYYKSNNFIKRGADAELIDEQGELKRVFSADIDQMNYNSINSNLNNGFAASGSGYKSLAGVNEPTEPPVKSPTTNPSQSPIQNPTKTPSNIPTNNPISGIYI